MFAIPVTKVASGVKGVAKSGLDVLKRNTINRFAGTTMKEGVKNWGKKIAGTVIRTRIYLII